jgi:hypothetical protein
VAAKGLSNNNLPVLMKRFTVEECLQVLRI